MYGHFLAARHAHFLSEQSHDPLKSPRVLGLRSRGTNKYRVNRRGRDVPIVRVRDVYEYLNGGSYVDARKVRYETNDAYPE